MIVQITLLSRVQKASRLVVMDRSREKIELSNFINLNSPLIHRKRIHRPIPDIQFPLLLSLSLSLSLCLFLFKNREEKRNERSAPEFITSHGGS